MDIALGKKYFGNLAAGSAFARRKTRSPPSTAYPVLRKLLRGAWQPTLGRG